VVRNVCDEVPRGPCDGLRRNWMSASGTCYAASGRCSGQVRSSLHVSHGSKKILAMRQGGSAWADIAYACGSADQANMINYFAAIVGEPPQQVFRMTAVDTDCEGNTPIGQSDGPNFFEC
jgi:hypothetical protein